MCGHVCWKEVITISQEVQRRGTDVMAKKGVELPPFQGQSVEVIYIDHSTIDETRVFISTVVEVNSNVT